MLFTCTECAFCCVDDLRQKRNTRTSPRGKRSLRMILGPFAFMHYSYVTCCLTDVSPLLTCNVCGKLGSLVSIKFCFLQNNFGTLSWEKKTPYKPCFSGKFVIL